MTPNIQLTDFFRRYGEAYDDAEKILNFYGDFAVASMPEFVGCLKGKDELRTAFQQVAEHQKRTGMKSLTPSDIQISEVDERHVWAKVAWTAKFEKTGDRPVHFEISYLLRQNEESFVILAYVSHQSEQQMRAELGLI